MLTEGCGKSTKYRTAGVPAMLYTGCIPKTKCMQLHCDYLYERIVIRSLVYWYETGANALNDLPGFVCVCVCVCVCAILK